jgi:AAA domain
MRQVIDFTSVRRRRRIDLDNLTLEIARDKVEEVGYEIQELADGKFKAQCPCHDDPFPSLSFRIGDDGKVHWHCHAGCSPEDTWEAVGAILDGEWEKPDEYPQMDLSGPGADAEGVTVEQLAHEKSLPVAFLTDELHWRDTIYPLYDTPAICFPYDGDDCRYRVSLNGSDHTRTRKGVKGIGLYGSAFVQVEDADEVVICEGETDAATLLYYGIPAMGVPGASSFSEAHAASLDRFSTVYVVKEKGDSGETLLRRVTATQVRERVRVIELGRFDDVADLHVDDPDSFVSRFEGYKRAAVSLVTTRPTLKFTRGFALADIEVVTAVWERRILEGFLNLLMGEEGVGKGTLIAWVLARITRGELQGEYLGTPRSILIVGDEDSWLRVWAPRLHLAGADPHFCIYLPTMDVREDLEEFVAEVERSQPALTYFDQLLDNLGAGVDSWKDKSVREALAPLRASAQELNHALLMTLHPNKRTGSFRTRLSGTPAFNALSKSSLFLGPHPYEPKRLALVRPKGNYTPEPPTFECRIESASFDNTRGATIESSRITDIEETDLDKDEVLEQGGIEKRTAVGEAANELRKIFKDGKERPADDVLAQMKALSFSDDTIRRAREKVGVYTRKAEYEGGWVWGTTSGEARPSAFSLKVE